MPPKEAALVPFQHACVIPNTPPVDVPWREPRWPAGVPVPADAMATYKEEAAQQIQRRWQKVARWSAARVAGRLALAAARLTRPLGESALRGGTEDF